MTRLFVALDIPEAVRAQVATLKDTTLRGARWTKASQWHLTLHFIGETEQADAIQAALTNVEADAFKLALRGIGTFPQRGQPRVLWTGVDAPDGLHDLHQSVGDALSSTGFSPETRPYQPHLTLARFNRDVPSQMMMVSYRQRHADFRSNTFPIDHFTLYASHLSADGSVYQKLQTYPLQ